MQYIYTLNKLKYWQKYHCFFHLKSTNYNISKYDIYHKKTSRSLENKENVFADFLKI